MLSNLSHLWVCLRLFHLTLALRASLGLQQPPTPCSSPRFVSDYGQNGFQAVCQHRLLQALGSGAARTFPPTQLEWIAIQEKASMALDVSCFNGM